MGIALKVQDFMAECGIEFDIVPHPHSHSSSETAEMAHIPGAHLAKSVVLEDDDGFVMAVLPASEHVRVAKLSRELNRHLRLASEGELAALFRDCDLGAVPPLGLAYGMRTVVDDRLLQQDPVYFEAGDHEKLIRVSSDAFRALMEHAGNGRFGDRMRTF